MKKWTFFLAALLLFIVNAGTSRSYAGSKLMSSTFRSTEVYYGMNRITSYGDLFFYVTVLTPGEVSYGQYNSDARRGDILPVISWTGSGPAPQLKLTDYGRTDTSNCPGINTKNFYCAYMTFDVTVESDNYGCPWQASFYSVSEQIGFGVYTSPTVHDSACPTIPVASFDISWSENYVSHNKALRLQSDGSTITTTLSTYLMESGKLCDGSIFDSRGAYCRAVSDLLTFTSYGCDNAKVTVTPARQPVTDRKLHDIVVQVNTSNREAIDSTCRFQYVLNEL